MHGVAAVGLAFLVVAGCAAPTQDGRATPTHAVVGTLDPLIGGCGGAAAEKGPVVPLLPVWQGTAEGVARRFAQVLGRELGEFGPLPRSLSDQGDGGWRVGAGFITIWDAPASPYDGQLVFFDPEWPGADQTAARDNVQDVLAALGAGSDTVSTGEAELRRLEWTQPSPAGPMAAGRSERTTEWTRSYFQRHYEFPDSAPVTPQAAVDLAATFDACRTTHAAKATAELPQPGVSGGRLAYAVVLAYGEGTPGGGNYHGCPPPQTYVTVDAVTGAILAWDDTYLCI